MYNREVLGQPLSQKVKELISEVQTIFPNKGFHIAKFEDASKELGSMQPMTDCIGASLPAITEFIAIWIRTDLPNEEFNAVLAEELLHHKQAYEGFPEIIDLRPRGFTSEIDDFVMEISSIICDLDAHHRMKTTGLDIEPLLATDLRNIRNSIKLLNSSEANIAPLKAGLATVSYFPKYLLFWFDLCDLGFLKYNSIWQNEINPWFIDVMPDTLRRWDELTTFIHNNPIINAESAKKAITIICQSLLYRTPTLRPKITHGISFPYLSKTII
jgi:hypothetical protein